MIENIIIKKDINGKDRINKMLYCIIIKIKQANY